MNRVRLMIPIEDRHWQLQREAVTHVVRKLRCHFGDVRISRHLQDGADEAQDNSPRENEVVFLEVLVERFASVWWSRFERQLHMLFNHRAIRIWVEAAASSRDELTLNWR